MILIGATTENPYFEVNGALLSRSVIFELKQLEKEEIKTLIRRLKRDNPNIEKSIFNSIHNVNIDTMPGYKTDGDYHTFLEKFDACMDGEPEE